MCLTHFQRTPCLGSALRDADAVCRAARLPQRSWLLGLQQQLKVGSNVTVK